MSNDKPILGIVRHGRFEPMGHKSESSGPTRLTTIPMQAARTPEGAELKLEKYEGHAILVQGIQSGAWIYSAKIIDKASPILTAVVKKALWNSDPWL